MDVGQLRATEPVGREAALTAVAVVRAAAARGDLATAAENFRAAAPVRDRVGLAFDAAQARLATAQVLVALELLGGGTGPDNRPDCPGRRSRPHLPRACRRAAAAGRVGPACCGLIPWIRAGGPLARSVYASTWVVHPTWHGDAGGGSVHVGLSYVLGLGVPAGCSSGRVTEFSAVAGPAWKAKSRRWTAAGRWGIRRIVWIVSHTCGSVAGIRVFMVVGPMRRLRVTSSRIVCS